MGFRGFANMESKGYAGGIVMGWKEDKIQIHILKLHFQFIHANVCTNDGHSWTLTAVYDNPREDNKKYLWKELESIDHIMAGDFNHILHMAEKLGGVTATRRRCSIF